MDATASSILVTAGAILTSVWTVAEWANDIANNDPRKLSVHHFLCHEPRPMIWGAIPIPSFPHKTTASASYMRTSFKSRSHCDNWGYVYSVYDRYMGVGPACEECGYANHRAFDWRSYTVKYGDQTPSRLANGVLIWSDAATASFLRNRCL